MVDVGACITGAIEKYRTGWQAVIVPFAVIFLLSLAFGAVTFGLSLVSQLVCKNTTNVYLLLALCYIPQILENLVNMIAGLISLIIIVAVLNPLYELVQGKRVSDWMMHLNSQWLNAVKIILTRFILSFVVGLPLLIFVAFNIAAIVAVVSTKTGWGALFALGSILLLVVLAAVTFTALVILNFLLTFLEIEVVIAGKGIVDAVKASIALVSANLVSVFLFNVVWWLVNIGVGIVLAFAMCTICLIPIALLVPSLIVSPVLWMSKLMLWREIAKPKK